MQGSYKNGAEFEVHAATNSYMDPARSHISGTRTTENLHKTSNLCFRPRKWTPGLFGSLPVLGLMALFGVVGGTAAAAAILIMSDQQPVDTWGNGISPAVYLAIVSVICNALLAYALVDGLVIVFWRKAVQGRTLSELNRTWQCGQSLKHAVFQGYRSGGKIAGLACIFSVLSLLRGPLNQRASTVQSDAISQTSGEISLSVARYLPVGFTGISLYTRGSGRETARLTPAFAKVMQEYSSRTDINITTEDASCGNSCSMTVKGFGFTPTCYFSEKLDIHDLTNFTSFDRDVFRVTSSLYSTNGTDPRELWSDVGIRFNVTYEMPVLPENKTGCRCSSMIEYKVKLASRVITLSPNRSDDRAIEAITLNDPRTLHDNIVGGFDYAASYLFKSSVVHHMGGAVQGRSFEGSLANEMVQLDLSENNATIKDPMDYMLDAMREIAFRAALSAGTEKDQDNITQALQRVSFEGSSVRPIYVTDMVYMAVAAALGFLSVLAVGATFYGWWELGWQCSMSPLNLARAFDAPLLDNALFASQDAQAAPRVVPEHRVQYGENVDGHSTGSDYSRLTLALENKVRRPRAGATYRC